MTRSELINRLTKMGMKVITSFNASGPVLHITGAFQGFFPVQVPVRVDDDHNDALQSFYSRYAKAMAELHGGRA